MMLDIFRIMDGKALNLEPIILMYEELFTDERKKLPNGTWQNDQNVIIIVWYV